MDQAYHGGGARPNPVRPQQPYQAGQYQDWQSGWAGGPQVEAYPGLALVPLQALPGITLQTLPQQPSWVVNAQFLPSTGLYGVPQRGPGSLPARGGRGGRSSAGGRGSSPARGGPPLGRGRYPGGRGAQGPQHPIHGNGRGSPNGPHIGRPHGGGRGGIIPGGGPSRGGGRGAQGNGNSGVGPKGQEPVKMSAKQRRLAEAEATPKPARPLTEEEKAEGARWQEERRRCYPTAENIATRDAEAKARAARGEIEPESQATRKKRLHDIIRLQRSLGLARAAGTDGMPLTAMQNGNGHRGRHGRGRDAGRGRGWGGIGRHTGSSVTEYHTPPKATTPVAESAGKRVAQEPPADELAAKRQHMGSELEEGPEAVLLGLADYDSDDDEGHSALASAGIESAGQEGLSMGVADKGEPSAPPTQLADAQLANKEIVGDRVSDSMPSVGNVGHTSTSTLVENEPVQGAAEAEAMQVDSVPDPSTSSIQAEEGGGAADGSAVPGNSATDASAQVKGDQEGCNEQAGSSKGGKQQRKRSAGGRDGQGGQGHGMQQQQPRRPSLLRALLAKDIRRERSHLLQCLRFLVKNNYLVDLGRKPLEFDELPPAQPDLQAVILKGLRKSLPGSVLDDSEREASEGLSGMSAEDNCKGESSGDEDTS